MCKCTTRSTWLTVLLFEVVGSLWILRTTGYPSAINTTTNKPRPTITFYNNQNPLSEVTFVNLQVRALMRDVKDPVRLAGRREEEALRILKHARAYLMEIQIAECQLREEYRMSRGDVEKYRRLWAETIEELNRLEAMFRLREQVNNITCDR